MLMVKDALQTASGFVAPADYFCLVYCRVPDDWVTGEISESSEMWLKGAALQEDKLEQLYRQLYGADWRNGNEDGSQYVVLSVGTRLLNPTVTDKPWELDEPDDKRFRYFYYVADADRKWQMVSRSDFSTDAA